MSELEDYDDVDGPQSATFNTANVLENDEFGNYPDSKSKLSSESKFSSFDIKDVACNIKNEKTSDYNTSSTGIIITESAHSYITKTLKYDEDFNLCARLSDQDSQQQNEASMQRMKISLLNTVPPEKPVQSRRKFKRDECIKLEKTVLEVTRRYHLKVKTVSFRGSTINIEFLDQLNATLIDTIKKELFSLLNLEHDQIQVTEGSSSENIVLTTNIGKAISSKRGDYTTKLGGVVWTKFIDSNAELKQFGLSCGHNKDIGDKITFIDGGREGINIPHNNNKCVEKRYDGCVVFSVSNNYYDVDLKYWRTLDASLIEFPILEVGLLQAELPMHEINIEPYVIRKISTADNQEMEVRVYIDSTYDSNDIEEDMQVQIFDVYGKKGRIVECSYTSFGDYLTPPYYRTFSIVDEEEEWKALHGSGDSGLLVTTVLNEADLSKDERGNYVGSVDAVGMLVAAVQDSSKNDSFKLSLALPLQEALEELKKCTKINSKNVEHIKLAGREPPNFATESGEQTVTSSGAYSGKNRKDSTTDYHERSPVINLGRPS